MKLEHIGIKEDGKAFRIINRALLDKELTELPKGKYRLLIEKYKRKKSNPQLGYLFACVYPLSQKLLLDAGWELATIDEVDVFWKSKFANREIVNRNTGEVENIPDLKRNFTTTDMMAYIDAIRNYCSEYLNGYIPGPEEQTKLFE
ncbi:MAG: hypothetical protein BWX92_04025 [Deltaproteobacteria bacterium ADurb.Bin135]|nr:MAG: hypothetical protein BWX92_04025 [Deltaproteobacteria bacterium ADurb.Bin135]